MEKQEVINLVREYVENILAFFDLNISVDVDIDGDIVVVKVPSSERNSLLIGRGADNLKSLQQIVATMLQAQQTGYFRVNLDIADYKKQHAEKIAEKARGWIEKVLETGESRRLDLSSADRWTVHRVAAEYEGVETYSEGEGRDRQLIIAKVD